MAIHHRVHHRKANVDDLEVFYREAGLGHRHSIVLLHGLPTSSHMYRALMPLLADRYHVVAPDFPGFGLTSCPEGFAYTFDSLAKMAGTFLEVLDVDEYTLFGMGLAAPVAFRLALEQTDCLQALIVQNGNAYEEGLRTFWDPMKRLWEDPSAANREIVRALLGRDELAARYAEGVRDCTRLDPMAWLCDHLFLQLPGRAEAVLDLLYDYRTNVELYPRFQAWFRENQPPTLVLWGENDSIHPVDAAFAFQKDMPLAEVELVESGHFALESKADEMSPVIRNFLERSLS